MSDSRRILISSSRIRSRVGAGDMEAAEGEFKSSLGILEDIQSRPELAQTLLAYGRFKSHRDADDGRRLIERALAIFEEIGATGWIAEARAALGQPT